MSARKVVKLAVFCLAFALVLPAILLVWIEKRWNGESMFVAFAQALSLVPGRIGGYVRAAFYYGSLDACSWETHVGFGSVFTHRRAAMGARVSMGQYCVVGHARLGDGVMMGSRISIPSGKRQHFDESGRITSETRFDTVTIGAGTWVGEGAIIMCDVGEGCIVSAGAVVTRDMPARCVIGGNPAKVLKELEQPLTSVLTG